MHNVVVFENDKPVALLGPLTEAESAVLVLDFSRMLEERNAELISRTKTCPIDIREADGLLEQLIFEDGTNSNTSIKINVFMTKERIH